MPGQAMVDAVDCKNKKEENVHFMSSQDPWETPQDFFDALDEIFAFELDVCAAPENAKCEKFITEEMNSFEHKWEGSCWMNPPYGRKIGNWIKKAKEEAHNGTTIVCLIPARTDTRWFQTVWDAKYIVFVHGRLKFGNATTPAPFPSALAVFGDEEDLPSDRELTWLTEHGTVIRPVWKYSPLDRPKEKKVWSVPFAGTVMEYRKAVNPDDEIHSPEDKDHTKIYNVQELKDVRSALPVKDNDTRRCEGMDESDGEPGGEA